MQQLKQKIWAQIFVIYTRFVLGGGFVFASVIKIKGRRFTTLSAENEPFGTPFHFFETMYQTGLYWQFLGWGQLLAGFLLMTQFFARLGAVVNFPIVLNVFVITLSMDFAYTPVITGMMLLANLGLLVWHWDSLRVLVNLPAFPEEKNRLEDEPVWVYLGFLLFLFTLIYRLARDRYDPVFWFGTCLLIGLLGLVLARKKIGFHLNKKHPGTTRDA
ncbi:hypothetical protein [Pararhodonellum marinum]|uniref:hypothetical protein n=1 Tax=Pararhodonellum marinum TaxID=2755358 RepID=UPI001890A5E7|nr:hypothetical protein [Pararhodonellum marinum]